ncbi:sqv-7, partial [Symbiodinium microadriaticum]
MKSWGNDQGSSNSWKLFSAIFYGIVSTAVIFINKIVLSTYRFHHFHFLAAAQFGWTALVLYVLYCMRKVDIPPLSFAIIKEIAPVSMLFFGNVLCGLGSTKSLNLPMFTVLRRFSILMTMIGEYIVLSYKPSLSVSTSVLLMIFGAAVAGLNDISFDLYGYVMVLLNNLFTALNGVYLKKASMSSKCSKMGVLFYNSAFSFFALVVYFLVQEVQTMLWLLSRGSSMTQPLKFK